MNGREDKTRGEYKWKSMNNGEDGEREKWGRRKRAGQFQGADWPVEPQFYFSVVWIALASPCRAEGVHTYFRYTFSH
jgi:hypothetical protein